MKNDAMQSNYQGIFLCFLLAIPSQVLGHHFPIVGGAVFAMLLGLLLGTRLGKAETFATGIRFTSKKILQYAVVLLGFGLNLGVVLETGRQSLPIILATIGTALFLAFSYQRLVGLPFKLATLIGVGSAICGGSAIAATAPVLEAEDEEVAQAISVIFFFNVLAALLFPTLGGWLGFSTQSGEAFGIFAGTAVNDTSSVTAAASTWDNLYQLGSQTLDKAVTVKLTRTLAIIPITMGLAYWRARRLRGEQTVQTTRTPFPTFILFFLLASVLTTLSLQLGLSEAVFRPLKELSKFFIVMAMAAIGLQTNLSQLVKKGKAPLLLGLTCWLGISLVSLCCQYLLGLW